MPEDERGLSPMDTQELRETVSAMSVAQVVSTLESLALMELELLGHPSIVGDQELRRASVWNAAALVAAAERLHVVPRSAPEPEEGGQELEADGVDPEPVPLGDEHVALRADDAEGDVALGEDADRVQLPLGVGGRDGRQGPA